VVWATEKRWGCSAVSLSARVAGSPPNYTMWRRLRPTSVSVPSGTLIHLGVWPQQTWTENSEGCTNCNIFVVGLHCLADSYEICNGYRGIGA